jgi:hypothetical protein
MAALISVWAGASLALRSNRRSLRQERSLSATEHCLSAVDKAFEEYRHISLIVTSCPESGEAHIAEGFIDKIMLAYDNFVNSEVGHEAWLLENRSITFSIAECLQSSMRLHLDSFTAPLSELKVKIDALSTQLWSTGEFLRAALLDKPVSELTEPDRSAIHALLPGRHIKK